MLTALGSQEVEYWEEVASLERAWSDQERYSLIVREDVELERMAQ